MLSQLALIQPDFSGYQDDNIFLIKVLKDMFPAIVSNQVIQKRDVLLFEVSVTCNFYY